MAELDKVIKGLEHCKRESKHIDDNPCNGCPYYELKECPQMMADALELLKEQDEIIQELINVGVPHNFQREQPWLVTYMYKITAIVQKAFKLKGEE